MTFHIEPCEHGFMLTIFHSGATVVSWHNTMHEVLDVISKEFTQ